MISIRHTDWTWIGFIHCPIGWIGPFGKSYDFFHGRLSQNIFSNFSEYREISHVAHCFHTCTLTFPEISACDIVSFTFFQICVKSELAAL